MSRLHQRTCEADEVMKAWARGEARKRNRKYDRNGWLMNNASFWTDGVRLWSYDALLLAPIPSMPDVWVFNETYYQMERSGRRRRIGRSTTADKQWIIRSMLLSPTNPFRRCADMPFVSVFDLGFRVDEDILTRELDALARGANESLSQYDTCSRLTCWCKQKIRLVDGQIVLPEVHDVVTERGLEALGGSTSRCLDFKDTWHRCINEPIWMRGSGIRSIPKQFHAGFWAVVRQHEGRRLLKLGYRPGAGRRAA